VPSAGVRLVSLRQGSGKSLLRGGGFEGFGHFQKVSGETARAACAGKLAGCWMHRDQHQAFPLFPGARFLNGRFAP
jgi:hypothetical protein